MTNKTELTWKKAQFSDRQSYTAAAGDNYYEVVELRKGEWGCRFAYPASDGKGGVEERGMFVPDVATYAKTLDQAKAFCELHWRGQTDRRDQDRSRESRA